MLRPTIRHRTVQPRDSGRLAPPTEPTESHGGLLSIPTHNYTIFPILLTRHPLQYLALAGLVSWRAQANYSVILCHSVH